MVSRSIWSVVCAALLLVLPYTATAQTPPHDSSNAISCRDCHDYIIQGGIFTIKVPRGEEQETTCKKCHSAGGQAETMSNVGNHLVDGGNIIVDCGSCHDPHKPNISADPHTGIEAENLSLIRNETRHVSGALDIAVFQERPGHFAFDDNNEPWNGICQTCHTQTNHHTNDATADHQHEAGSDCLTCHSHQAGFAASGGDCIGCHSNPQGSRRAAAAEFPADNAHAHYGTALDEASCLVCHSVGTHMDGYVELIDPDDGSIYRFASPGDITSDPDLSDFCANCHDNNGAQRLASPLDPFGNGNVPPDVATQFMGTLQWDEWYGDSCFGWEGTLRQVNSHHDISTADQTWSGAKIECLNCHGAHNASADTPIANPSDQTQIWTGEINDFCLTCHDGGNGPLDPAFPTDALGLDVFVPMTLANTCYNTTFGCTGSGTDCTTDADCPDIYISPMRGLDTGDCSYNVSPYFIDYTWTYEAHGLDSKRYWAGYPNLPGSDAVLDCTVCHDPHGSYTATNTLGNPYMIRDFVDGTPFIDDGNRPNPGTWAATPGTAGSVVVTVSGTNVDWGSENSLCVKCHATWEGAYSWHAYVSWGCTSCQTCHNHGQSWGGSDWGPAPDDSTNCWDIGGFTQSSASVPSTQFKQASSSHDENTVQSCSECHEPHLQ